MVMVLGGQRWLDSGISNIWKAAASEGFQISDLLFQMLLFEGCLMSETLLIVLSRFLGKENRWLRLRPLQVAQGWSSGCLWMKPGGCSLPGGAAEKPRGRILEEGSHPA